MNKSSDQKYISLMDTVDPEARPFTRWWWYGAAVEKAEISRQLQYMAAAGIGGVELQVLYPLEADDPDAGIINYPFYSPEFFERLTHTINECRRLGLFFDMTLGSSWPYGGPFVSNDMAAAVLLPYQFDILGPTVYSQDFTGLWAGEVIQAVLCRLDEGRVDEASVTDITGQLEQTWIYSWPYGWQIRDLDVSPGQWRLFIFVSSEYRQRVGAPARGMDGFVIDHCRREVTDHYLANIGEPFTAKLGHGAARTFFCDSIELGGSNFTPAIFTAFRARRGYDLKQYLPAMWSDMGSNTERVRWDYYKTMSDLTIENFFEPVSRWSRSQGSRSRFQAHGTWADILRVYASADIPEGETFGEGDCLEVNTVHRRLASSAGHIYGRNVISNESFTWLRMPRFLVTLEMIKLAADAIFLDGINHIVNHGYAYSPARAGLPGQAFYASSLISHTNTWWKHYPPVAAYKARVSSMLQRGCNVAEVAIYIPQNDIWSQTPLAELHLSMKIEGHIGKEVIQAVQNNGYWFDYINDDALLHHAAAAEGALHIQNNLYKALIIPNCRYLPLETAKKLKEFAEAGGTVIALGQAPTEVPGLSEYSRRQQELEMLLADLFGKTDEQWHRAGEGWTIVTALSPGAVVRSLQQSLVPDLFIESEPTETGSRNVGYVHRRTAEEDIYFLANVSRQAETVHLHFKGQSDCCTLLDPLERTAVFPRRIDNHIHGVEFTVDFEPGMSLFAVFSDALPPLQTEPSPTVDTESHAEISGPWTLEVEAMDFAIELQQPIYWSSLSPVRYHCGTGAYQTSFELETDPASFESCWLCLEHLAATADIYVNGCKAGVLWKHPYRLNIQRQLRPGVNTLEIQVQNLWINAFLDPNHDEAAHSEALIDNWPYFSEIIDQNRSQRLHGWREREMIKTVQPSGLSGKVWLSLQWKAEGSR